MEFVEPDNVGNLELGSIEIRKYKRQTCKDYSNSKSRNSNKDNMEEVITK
jgi:hypothetical protein